MTGNLRLRAPFLALIVLLVLAGCGGDDSPTKPVPPANELPAGTPAADSPTHLAERLEATWQSKNLAEYAKLLNGNFRFQFSVQADPVLADEYPNWGPDDDVLTLAHVFSGFTNSQGVRVPGASRIDMSQTGVSVGNDPEHPDSTVHYRKLVITTMDLDIEVQTSPDPVIYQVSSRQELYVVRGDAAIPLPGSPADSTRWYIRRWDDLATAAYAGKGPVIHPASATSLGSIKAAYRR